MSVDVGALLQTATPLAASALATSGTVVDVVRAAHGTDDATVDPITLQISDPTPEKPVESDLPALISYGGRGATQDDGPQRPQGVPVYTVSIDPAIVSVRPRDVVIPSASPDPLLVGARLVVDEVTMDGTGLFRDLICKQEAVGDGG